MHNTSIHFKLLSYPSSILNTLPVLEYGLVLPDVEKRRLELFLHLFKFIPSNIYKITNSNIFATKYLTFI